MFDDRSTLLLGSLRRFRLDVLVVGCAVEKWQNDRSTEGEVWAGGESVLCCVVNFGCSDQLGVVCPEGRFGNAASA